MSSTNAISVHAEPTVAMGRLAGEGLEMTSAPPNAAKTACLERHEQEATEWQRFCQHQRDADYLPQPTRQHNAPNANQHLQHLAHDKLGVAQWFGPHMIHLSPPLHLPPASASVARATTNAAPSPRKTGCIQLNAM